MPDKVAPDLYRIEVPLPDSSLKAINVYVVKSADRNLVIDTGMNVPECQKVLEEGLRELDAGPAHTDYFITHFHSDHMGLVGAMAGPEAKVYYNELEADFLKNGSDFESRMGAFSRKAGFSEQELMESMSKHPGRRHAPRELPEFTILHDGDTLAVGEYRFECVQTPGHTIGHMCLYDRDRKIFLSGDHVLGNISPNITSFSEEENPLGDYLASLEKVRDFDVDLCLPGHRDVIHDFRGRVDELRDHHEERLLEALGILDGGGGMAATEVASRMSWSMNTESWDEVPAMQKWFATGEAFAHLRLLIERGLIQSELQDGRVIFSGA